MVKFLTNLHESIAETVMYFYRRMVGIEWIECPFCVGIQTRKENVKNIMLIRMKRWKKIIRKIMKKVSLGTLTLTWHNDGKQWKPTGTTGKSEQMKGN